MGVVNTAAQPYARFAVNSKGRSEVLAQKARQALYKPKPRRYDTAMGKGLENLQSNNYIAALEEFQSAISIDSTIGDGYFSAAFCLMQLNRVEEAIIYYSKSEKYNPSNMMAVLRQGQLLDEIGRLEEAKNAFERILAHDERDPWANYYLAGYVDDSAVSFETVVRADEMYVICTEEFLERIESSKYQLSTSQKGLFYEIVGNCFTKLQQYEKVGATATLL